MTRPWSNLAAIVGRRTYSRVDNPLTGPEVGRDSQGRPYYPPESWDQIIERVVAGNVRGHSVPESEVQELLRLGKERKAIPAGRGLWFSGTGAHALIGGEALNNCWYLNSSEWTNFVEAQNLLMLGGGVGMSVEQRFTSKLPRVKTNVTITHRATKNTDLIVPDTREGWCELTRRVLEAFFQTGRGFSYSTFCIRGYGEPINGFGGTASGPIPLIKFIETICGILRHREGNNLRPIDAGDLITATGEMVVAGNVRRSAIILIGDAWDKEYLRAKRWDLGPIPTHRDKANYSVVCDDAEDLHPSYWKTFENGEAFGLVNRKAIRKYGRMGELKKDTAEGVNPCQPETATVLTPDGIKKFKDIEAGSTIWSGLQWTKVTKKVYTGVRPVYKYTTNGGCFEGTENHIIISNGVRIEVDSADSIDASVLSPTVVQQAQTTTYKVLDKISCGVHPVYDITVAAPEHTYWTGGLLVSNCAEATLESHEPCNLQELALRNLESEEEFEHAARLMHRYGKRVTLERYHSENIQEVVSRNRRVGTGITGCLASPLFNPKTLDRVYAAIQAENRAYSKNLGIPESIRTTVIKPSGTVSKALDMDGFEGIHAPWSRWIIQRIRFSSNDKLIPLLREAGHYMEPVLKLDGTRDQGTLVVDFYVEAPAGCPVSDEDFDTWKQLEVVKLAQKHWSDQSVSASIYYKREDIPKIKEWLANNFDELKTISFMAHSEHGYAQAPKESISQEQYEKLSAKIKPIDADLIGQGDLENQECAGGSCPVK